jgi:hypothetical protein
MLSAGTIIKSETEDAGTTFYRVASVVKTSYMIKPLCKIRKGFQIAMYHKTDEIQILQSEVGYNYLEATRKEVARIKKSIDM